MGQNNKMQLNNKGEHQAPACQCAHPQTVASFIMVEVTHCVAVFLPLPFCAPCFPHRFFMSAITASFSSEKRKESTTTMAFSGSVHRAASMPHMARRVFTDGVVSITPCGRHTGTQRGHTHTYHAEQRAALGMAKSRLVLVMV